MSTFCFPSHKVCILCVWYYLLVLSEEDLLRNLRAVISGFSPSRNRADHWVWKHEQSGSYTVKSAYENLIGQVQTLEGGAFKELWAVKAPSNALALAWRVLWGRVPTRDNLRQRQVLSEEADISCPLCWQTVENISHLFFFCNISWRVWMMVYNWCGISSVFSAGHFCQFYAVPARVW